MLNRFLVDSENTVRQFAELALSNWIASQLYLGNEDYCRDSAILAERFLEEAKAMVLDDCQQVRRVGRNPPGGFLK